MCTVDLSTIISKRGYYVKSYGMGTVVRLPGAASDQPNIYSFGTTYEEMYKDLVRKDPQLYLAMHNAILLSLFVLV